VRTTRRTTTVLGSPSASSAAGAADAVLATGVGGPGDVTGQSVDDVWWVVGPDGQKVSRAPAGDPGFSY
jgi:hypothetical protein